MTDPAADIVIAEDDGGLAAAIEAALLSALRTSLPQATNSAFVLTAKDAGGDLVGGLTASTAYGWLLIKTLWVAKEHRGRGLGGDLVGAAETRGRQTGCHGAWLDTSSPAAARFYARQGYETFGELANRPGQQPESHRRRFMRKTL